MEKGQTQIQLRGPYHPLEYKLNPIHMVGSQWLVRVEPESVNSVLLDDQPDEAVDQFMVAAHIGLNPSGRALMVRATTLMPNKLCLGALLTMIFAPKVEVRAPGSNKSSFIPKTTFPFFRCELTDPCVGTPAVLQDLDIVHRMN